MAAADRGENAAVTREDKVAGSFQNHPSVCAFDKRHQSAETNRAVEINRKALGHKE